ncbi:hypothetical protein A9Z42_0081410 [Trichoderma parareesei]|uniref:Uncharacterized protein n=1 Tax=Trichoderma parareesei TaxID=858221 RepID=A0A2H2Z9N8_TRIPA|nr:hypothetical protein A9Z42_0081410 [Trichoderma parareesei]
MAAMDAAVQLTGLEAVQDVAERVGEEWRLVVVIMPSTILDLDLDLDLDLILSSHVLDVCCSLSRLTP